MKSRKYSKTAALILALLMFFSNAVIAMALPEKVQISVDSGIVEQYDYYTVLDGGVNRERFIQSLRGIENLELLILSDSNIWYNVDGISLDQAKSKGLVTAATEDYVAVLENGAETSPAASLLIDHINGTLSLDDPDALQSLYNQYRALTDAERDAIANDPAINVLLEKYDEIIGIAPDPEEPETEEDDPVIEEDDPVIIHEDDIANGNVAVDLSVSKAMIAASVTGTVTVTGTAGAAGTGTIQNGLTISEGVTVNNLIMRVGGTIHNAGAITTLNINLTGHPADVVILQGSYTGTAITFTGTDGFVTNQSGEAITVNGSVSVPDKGTYPSGTGIQSPAEAALDAILSEANYVVSTQTSLTLGNFKTAGVNISGLQANGDTAIAAINAVRYTALTASVTSLAHVQTAVNDAVSALTAINNAVKSDDWGTPQTNGTAFMNNLRKAGIYEGTKTWTDVQTLPKKTYTFDTLQNAVEKAPYA